MRRVIFVISLVTIVAMHHAGAQVLLSLVMKNPAPPQLSVWESDPTVVQLVINNTSGIAYPNVRVSFTITDANSNAVAASTKDNDPGIPRFDLPAQTVLTKLGPALVNLNAVTVDQSLQQKAVTTNSLPEGDYQICVKLLDQNGVEIPTSGLNCRTFTVVISDPPALITPADNALLSPVVQPTFTWTSVVLPGGGVVKYRLVITPIFGGQTAKNAIEQNTPLFDQTLAVPSYFYSPSNPPFSQYPSAEGFAWQVQAVDAQGLPVTRNEGKSTVSGFALGAAQSLTNILLLTSPEDNAQLTTRTPTFAWAYIPPAGTDVSYRLKVVPQLAGQTPEQAIAGNAPLLDLVLPGSQKSAQPPAQLGFKDKGSYAWQVQAVKAGTNAVLKVSSARRFSFKETLFSTIAGMTTVKGLLNYEYADPGEYIGWPLGNVNVKLVVKYVLKYTLHSAHNAAPKNVSGSMVVDAKNLPPALYGDNDKVLAVGKTSSTGDFLLTAWQFDTTGIVSKGFMAGDFSTEFYDYYKGDLYRVYRIIVEDPHYCSPDYDIQLKPGETKNIGNLFANVRSYSLTVQVLPSPFPEEQATHGALAGMTVYLLRQIRPQNVPVNEGSPRPKTPETMSGMEVVATGITSDNPPGFVTFSRVVKNVGPNDKYYVCASSDPDKGKWNYRAGAVKAQFANDQDKAVFNAEYLYLNFAYTVYATPLMPTVKGRVVLAGGGRKGEPVDNAKVQLLKYALIFWSEERSTITPAAGTFSFPYLNVQYDQQGNVSGPIRGLRVTKPGYKKTDIALPKLKFGEQWISNNILLEPASTVTGKIVDESGNGVASNIIVGGGQAVEAKIQGIVLNPLKILPAVFTAQAEMLPQSQRIIIEPKSTAYFRDTIWAVINKETVDLGSITVHKKVHRIVLMVREQIPNMPFANWPRVQGAKVHLKDLNIDITTDSKGEAYFQFESDGSQFLFVITAPPGKYYLRSEHAMTHVQSWYSHFEPVGLTKATYVSGHVAVGKQKMPVEKASVFIDQGSASNRIQTQTDASGFYLLPNVPIGTMLTVWATKPSKDTTFVGDSVAILSKAGGNDNVDFLLTVYAGMDITRLMGFPVEVQSLQELPGGKVQISGTFSQFPGNAQFSVPADSTAPVAVTFTQVPIKPGTALNSKGIPIAQPVTLPVPTNQNTMDLTVYKTFAARLHDQNIGIHLDDPGTGMGVIKGSVHVNVEQFSTGGSLTDWDGFSLAIPAATGPEKMMLPVITASGKPAVNAPVGLAVVSDAGDSIHFTINGFAAASDPSGSYILDDTVRLSSRLHTALDNISPPDLNLALGDVRLHKSGLEPIGSTTPLSMKLGNWTIDVSQWIFYQSDITVQKGVLKTGAIDVPIKTLNVKPTTLANADFDLASLSVGGIVPLTVTASPVLDYDASQSEWYLFISNGTTTPCAFMIGLPGMEPGAKIQFQAVRLTSKGDQQLSPMNTPLAIYKVAKLVPDMVSVFPDFVEITGLSLTIPKLGNLNAAIHYSKGSGGGLAFRMVPVVIGFSTNGVDLKYGQTTAYAQTQKLDEKGFVAQGTVEEAGKFSLVTWLYRTVDSTSVWVDTSPKQSLPIGAPKTSLQNITGAMRVEGNDWTNFWFAGDLQGTKGIADAKKRLTFTVVGEITANNQELAVKNIPTPFGGMNWRYDFEKSRLTGDMTINQSFAGLAIENGVAECVVDGSGWYFIAGGILKVPGIGDAHAALFFGDYPLMVQSVKDKFAGASYNKKLPASFEKNISGFLFSGAIAVPVIVPDLDLNLVIASAKFGVKAGADVRVWRGFDESGTEYGIGAIAFVHAYLSMGSMTCTELGADALAELGFQGIYNTGQGTFAIDGCGGLSLGAHISQKFWGCDFDGCGCRYTIFEQDFGFAVKAMMHLDSGGGKSLSFDTGTCSGN